jgi:phosphinothricin acetyltransferase
MAAMNIRPAEQRDSAAIAAIYNHYVATTCITFETESVSNEKMGARIDETHSSNLPWLIAEEDGAVVGYAYASKWKGRCAYRYSVESTVYLDPASKGKGLGRALYVALIEALRTRSMQTVIGGIALPNDASIALHERMGFEKVAHFKRVGFKQDRWIDVGYWQLLLDAMR